jgi:hypothetical protein
VPLDPWRGGGRGGYDALEGTPWSSQSGDFFFCEEWRQQGPSRVGERLRLGVRCGQATQAGFIRMDGRTTGQKHYLKKYIDRSCGRKPSTAFYFHPKRYSTTVYSSPY